MVLCPAIQCGPMRKHQQSFKIRSSSMIGVLRISQQLSPLQRGCLAGQTYGLAHRCRKKPFVLLCLLALLIAICPRVVMAQELSATLTGLVTDSTGAVVPHASIAISLNGVNGVIRTVESDGDGNYVASNLTAGTYSITVTSAGFETYKASDIILNVAEKHSVNAQLKPGATSMSITVEDNPVSVDLDSSAQAGTISGVQLRELEISDRNFAMLVTLQPGVVNAGLGDEANTESNTGLAVNGGRPTANNWTVDGADINDSGSNQTLTNTPSIDAIQEFTLQRGSYDAGYGRSGGGQVLVATKQGSSSYHGDAYEFVRNNDFNANEWFTKQGEIASGLPNKPTTYHRNDFGYTFGGPIFIPNHYNSDKKKTFFFWSQEWQKSDVPLVTVLPAASGNEVAGIIADGPGNAPYAPSQALPKGCALTSNESGAPITVGSVSVPNHSTYIPSTCWSQNATVYNTKVFAPNTANNGSNDDFSLPATTNFRQEILRIDHNFSDKLHFFARGMEDISPTLFIGGLWGGASGAQNYPGLADSTVNTPGKNVVANLTWTISPRLVNELELVFAQGEYIGAPVSGQFFNDTTGLSLGGLSYTDPYGRVPAVAITGVASYVVPVAPYKERNLDRTVFDNFTAILGKHTFRAGFQFQQMLKTENLGGGQANFTFDNTNANADPANSWSYGDFLLGQAAVYTQGSKDTTPGLHFINSEAYVQDDWKISHKLTVNLGVRWSRFPAPADDRNTMVNFDLNAFSPANAPTLTTGIGGGNFQSGPYQTTVGGEPLLPANYANGLIFPAGAECTAAKALAPLASCSPYGAAINPTHNGFAPRIGFAYNPDGNGKTSIRAGFGIFYDRVLDGIWEDSAFFDPPFVQTATINNAPFDKPSGGSVAAPSTSPNGLFTTGNPDFKIPSYANYNLSVQRQLLPTTTLEIAYVGNQARHLLGQVDANQPTLAKRTADEGDQVNVVRNYAGYGVIDQIVPMFTNNFNALEVSLNHKAHGLTLGVAYTWSKDLTTSSADRFAQNTNTYDIKLDYGPSSFNTPQVAEVSYVYDTPWYANQQGAIGRILGGWEVSGITSFISGGSTRATQTTDPFNSGSGNGGLGLGAAYQFLGGPTIRPDQTGPVHLTKTVSQWFQNDGKGNSPFFNAAANHFGSEGNGAILGPGVQRWDMAAIKNVNLAGPVKFQLRGEFFNAFNHENFSGVGTTLGTSSFGTLTSGHNPRIIQVAGKLIF
jgi:hypothetical protein